MQNVWGSTLLAGDCFQRPDDPNVYHAHVRMGDTSVVAKLACIHQPDPDGATVLVEANDTVELLSDADVAQHQHSQGDVPILHNWMAEGRYTQDNPYPDRSWWIREYRD